MEWLEGGAVIWSLLPLVFGWGGMAASLLLSPLNWERHRRQILERNKRRQGKSY